MQDPLRILPINSQMIVIPSQIHPEIHLSLKFRQELQMKIFQGTFQEFFEVNSGILQGFKVSLLKFLQQFLQENFKDFPIVYRGVQ